MKISKNELIGQIKLILKHMMVGFLVIAALGIGFLAIIWGSLGLPALRWFKRKFPKKEDHKDTGKYNKNSSGKGKTIDAEYEILDE